MATLKVSPPSASMLVPEFVPQSKWHYYSAFTIGAMIVLYTLFLRMENRWNGVEDRLNAFDQNRDDELVALAYRLDEIKAQINALDKGSGIEVLEGKLVAVAQAIEMLGRQIQPDERRLAPQFADLDKRLDEISRAIAAGGRNSAGADGSFVDRLESRLGDLSRQMDTLSNPVESGLGARIEALAARVEDLAGEKAAARLEERLDQLSAMNGNRAPPPDAAQHQWRR